MIINLRSLLSWETFGESIPFQCKELVLLPVSLQYNYNSWVMVLRLERILSPEQSQMYHYQIDLNLAAFVSIYIRNLYNQRLNPFINLR